jgi:hypothetical protein
MRGVSWDDSVLDFFSPLFHLPLTFTTLFHWGTPLITGKCVQDSCQYVGLKQRYEGYKKGKAAVELASKALNGDLKAAALGEIAFPAECSETFEKALRRCALLSNALLISENYGTSNEALVARFYLNEAFYGSKMLAAACKKGDLDGASEAWDLCRFVPLVTTLNHTHAHIAWWAHALLAAPNLNAHSMDVAFAKHV